MPYSSSLMTTQNGNLCSPVARDISLRRRQINYTKVDKTVKSDNSINQEWLNREDFYLKTSLPPYFQQPTGTCIQRREAGRLNNWISLLHGQVRDKSKKKARNADHHWMIKTLCNAECRVQFFALQSDQIKRHLAVDCHWGFFIRTANLSDDAGLIEMLTHNIDYFLLEITSPRSPSC